MKDDKTVRKRLEEVRDEFLHWDERDPRGTRAGTIYSTESYRPYSKQELQGWIQALEWILGRG